MKRPWILGLLLLLTILAVAATAQFLGRGKGGSRAIEAFVDPKLNLQEGPWMLSSSRMSRGRAVHVSRQNLPDGGVRVVVDDANTFSGDTVTIDLEEGPAGSVRARAKVEWIGDMGPPFEGTWQDLVGGVTLSSAPLRDAHPLIIDFTLHEKGGDYPGCEHGVVSVP